MDLHFLFLGFFAFLSYFSAIFAGFGGVIIALALGAHLYPIKWLLPILLPLTLIANLYIFIRHHRQINTQVLIGRILPMMGTGLIIGYALFSVMRRELLQTLFGVLVVLVSVRELIKTMSTRPDAGPPLSGWVANGYVFGAGVIHGIYACGGPLLVYAVNKMQLRKSAFRSTLSTVWLTMNIFLTTFYSIAGRIDLTSLKFSASLLPSLVAGMILGELLHERVPERVFKIAAFALLTLSGILITLN